MKSEEIPYEPLLTQYLFNKASKKSIPLSGTFELTPLCNFNCRMCYVRLTPDRVRNHPKKMLTLEQWKSIADQAKQQGMLYLLLTGGEPFMWPDFWKLYEYLSGKGFIMTVNSNGSLIDREAVKRLKEMPPIRINITLYGASDQTYEKLCRADCGFQKVDRAVSLLREAGIQVKLNCSLTPYNVCDLEEMVRYAEERELILETNSYMFPPLRKDPEQIGTNDRFTPEEAAKWYIRRFALQHTEERYRSLLKGIIDGMGAPVGLDTSCYDPTDGKISCRAGNASFWITWDGYMLPCGMMPKPRSDMTSCDFRTAWKEINEKSDRIALSGLCTKCDNRSICHSCAAMAIAETGEFGKVPEYLCKMMRSMQKIARIELEK